VESNVGETVWEFIKQQATFIILATGAIMSGIFYLARKHDERRDKEKGQDAELKRLDTKIDSISDVLNEKIAHLREWLAVLRGKME